MPNFQCQVQQSLISISIISLKFLSTKTKNDFLGSNDTNICGPKKYQCCKDASHDIYTSGTFDECNCLPTCRLISYDAVATQGDYDLSTAWAKSKFRKIFSFDE